MCALLTPMVAIGSTIQVPADQPTIQQAIDAAVDGDVVVLVSPGTYNENIDFKGKAITVRSIAGPNATVFRGDQTGPVVTCATTRWSRAPLNEGPDSFLNGFSIRKGGTPNFCCGASYTLLTGASSQTAQKCATNSYSLWILPATPFDPKNLLVFTPLTP